MNNMKVSAFTKMNNFLSRQFNTEKGLKNLAKISMGMFLGGVVMQYGEHSANAHLIYDIQQKVKQTGISQKEFEKLDDNISNLSSRDGIIAWQEALDSIKNQGKIEKAYFEGLQAAKSNQNK